MFQVSRLLFTLLLAQLVASAPAASSSTVVQEASSTVSGIDATATVPLSTTDPNQELWGPDSNPSVPAPQRNKLGASIIGPSNPELELQNADLLAPPTTDSGDV